MRCLTSSDLLESPWVIDSLDPHPPGTLDTPGAYDEVPEGTYQAFAKNEYLLGPSTERVHSVLPAPTNFLNAPFTPFLSKCIYFSLVIVAT